MTINNYKCSYHNLHCDIIQLTSSDKLFNGEVKFKITNLAVGFGKGVLGIAAEIERVLGNRITDGENLNYF